MAQLPRKPTFPPFMIDKIISKIQKEVQEDVIPVSTGIYSYQKLKQKLQAIPKPQLEDYDDKIFYDILDKKTTRNKQKCPICFQDYTNKNIAVMCCFCGVWNCNQCLSHRKRPHPRSKDTNGQRYDICVKCDTKFLNLQLHHSYVQKRSLLQEAITKVTKMLQQKTSQKQQIQKNQNQLKDNYEKNVFKISQIKKQKLGLTKTIKKQKQQLEKQHEKNQIIKQKFVEAHIKKVEYEEKLKLFQQQNRINKGQFQGQKQQTSKKKNEDEYNQETIQKYVQESYNQGNQEELSMDDILNGQNNENTEGLAFLDNFQKSNEQNSDQDQFHKSILEMNRNTRLGGNFQDRNTYRQAVNFDDYVPEGQEQINQQEFQQPQQNQQTNQQKPNNMNHFQLNEEIQQTSQNYKQIQNEVEQYLQRRESINQDQGDCTQLPQQVDQAQKQRNQEEFNRNSNENLFTFKQNLQDTTMNSFPNNSYFVQQTEEDIGIINSHLQQETQNKKGEQQLEISDLIEEKLPKLNLSHFRSGYNQSYVQKQQKQKQQPVKMTLSNYQQKKKYAQIVIEEPTQQQFTFSQSAISPKSNNRTNQSMMQQYFRESYRTNQQQNQQSFIRMANEDLCQNYNDKFQESIVKDEPCQSQVDQEQLKNAKYNLIKAARQSAMQSRKFQQIEATIVVNKCQCVIY